jgi:type II secretory pathway pseudopilin PulG
VVGVRLADDERGRVPFAVVGVLLLLGSTAYATTLSTRGPTADDRALDRAVASVEASADAALREAVAEAAREAAREPVTEPATTPTGRALRGEPFRDALRVRVYVAARAHLRTTAYRRDGVRARASLPATRTPAALRAARDRVTVERASNGTALRVEIDGVRYVASRDGREAVNETRTATLTVASPVLSLHDRTTRFERRLNAGPTRPGLGRRLTARLYPLAWARGYGQYHGLPVENVVANRHVAVATNGAVLRAERAAFGRADPGGRRGLRRAHARLFAAELGAAGVPTDRADRVLAAPNAPGDGTTTLPRVDAASVPTPASSTTVDAATAVNRSLGRLVGPDEAALDAAVRAGYRVRGRLRARTTTVEREPRPDPVDPGGGYSLDGRDVDVRATVLNASTPLPAVPAGERRVVAHERRVELHHTVAWDWVDGNDTETTTGTWTTVHEVSAVVTVEPDRRAPGPNRTVDPAFERGGPLDGPNMADTPTAVRETLVAAQGGPDAVATALARGATLTDETTVVGDRPEGLDRYVYAGLRRTRERVGRVAVEVRRGRVATGRTNPPALLVDRLRERRSALVDAPRTYEGAAERARVAARTRYLNRTVAALERRAEARRTRVAALDDLLRDRANVSLDRVARDVRARRNATDPERRVAGHGPAGPLVTTPDGSPAYLTVEAVGHDRAAALDPGERVRPLAARNVNLFTVPSGDAVDTVASAGDGAGVGLRAAGRTLVAAERTDANGTDRLARATADRLDTVRGAADRVLARETTLGPGTRRTAVRAALDRWDGPGRRALAAANGSLSRAVAAEATARTGGDGLDRSRLAAALGPAVGDAAGSASVDGDLVSETAAAARSRATARARSRVVARANETGERAYRRALDAARGDDAPPAPVAGLPVAPVPGYWYLTVNVWRVDIRGSWERFAVRTRRGGPGAPVTYVRDGSVARLDWDEDGTAERLGRDERVAFETNTTVVVAVPPGGRGVGDVDGNADERSAGWATGNRSARAAR